VEVRDPVHGTIPIQDEVVPIITHEFFQRLRSIKQLGFSEYVFPGGTHTRYIHSLGVMHIGDMAFKKIFKRKLRNAEVQRMYQTFKLACMLHDIGHAPLSHASEFMMPKLRELKLSSKFTQGTDKSTQATHEHYTIKIITDSSFNDSFKNVHAKYGVLSEAIASLILGENVVSGYFDFEGTNYFPLLHQLVSSELDCDRMDYLLRDSYFCGVSYGNYDLNWLIDNLTFAVEDNKAYLGIFERAVLAFDDFLLSRYHMFIMVYFHYRSVCLEKLLLQYFKTSHGEYTITANIEDYIHHNDHHLIKIMKNSENAYAQAVIKNQIPEKIFEAYNDPQKQQLGKIEDYLLGEDIEFIKSSSTGRLSKYYGAQEQNHGDFPIKVVRSSRQGTQLSSSNIFDATDLFEKFSKSHAIGRLYCDIDGLSPDQRGQLNKLLI
jgi:uncharacterized protein